MSLTPISKKEADKRKRDAATGGAIAGAGAVTAGTGLVAGGVPGGKSDFTSVLNLKEAEGKGLRRAYSAVRNKAPAARATPGGILGFREHAHKGGLYGFTEQAAADAKKASPGKRDSFYRGYNKGKIEPEVKILRGMTRGHKGANAALVAGTGATLYGTKKLKDSKEPKKQGVSKAERDAAAYSGALAGAGTAGAVTSHAGSKVLDKYKRKYAETASRNVDEAGKLVPALAGREGKKLTLKQMHRHKTKNPGEPFPKSMYPTVRDGSIKRNPKLLAGVDPKIAEQAGSLRGAAAQERHFSEVFGNTSKVVRSLRTPSAVAGAAGVGGIAMTNKKDAKKKVSKRDQPQTIKAVREHYDKTGLGAAAVAGAGAGASNLASARYNAKAMDALIQGKKRTAQLHSIKGSRYSHLGAGLSVAGIGALGAGHYANERKKDKKVKKSDDAPYVGEVGIAKRYEDELPEIKDEEAFSKNANLTKDQIARKKSRQSRYAQTTGALGLASVGAFGAARLGGTTKTALQAQKHVPALKRINPKEADKIALGASTAAGGIGGLGAFNFASYTKAEADKNKKVKKSFGPGYSAFGVTHH